jgi:hypothetical protein
MRAHRTGACGEVNACAVLLRLFSVSGGRPFGASTITWGKTNDNPTPRVRLPCFNKVSWGCLEFQLANGMNTTYTPSARRTSPLADISKIHLTRAFNSLYRDLSIHFFFRQRPCNGHDSLHRLTGFEMGIILGIIESFTSLTKSLAADPSRI